MSGSVTIMDWHATWESGRHGDKNRPPRTRALALDCTVYCSGIDIGITSRKSVLRVYWPEEIQASQGREAEELRRWHAAEITHVTG